MSPTGQFSLLVIGEAGKTLKNPMNRKIINTVRLLIFLLVILAFPVTAEAETVFVPNNNSKPPSENSTTVTVENKPPSENSVFVPNQSSNEQKHEEVRVESGQTSINPTATPTTVPTVKKVYPTATPTSTPTPTPTPIPTPVVVKVEEKGFFEQIVESLTGFFSNLF